MGRKWSTSDSVCPQAHLTELCTLLECIFLVKKCFFFTFAPGIARLFFRVRDNSILPPRLPTCTGSNGIEEYIGSVNWGWGSHIILGFQLGESFGSVCCKKKKEEEINIFKRLIHTTLLCQISKDSQDQPLEWVKIYNQHGTHQRTHPKTRWCLPSASFYVQMWLADAH